MAKTKKEPIKTVKGMHDILPDLLPYYEKVIKETRRVAEYYGFQAIQMPHVERLELFTASLGDASDVVEKQMYTFRTRGGSPLVLRPEGTASAVRAYFEHGMQSWPQPVKLFYGGSFFRHENPQAGRTREFQQCGVEIIGEGDSIHDAIVIRILISSLESLHLHNMFVGINSIGDKNCRPQYRKELSIYYRRRQQALCYDCKRRLRESPLRLLDCKNPDCIVLRKEAPQFINHLCEYCKNHLKAVLEYLDEMRIPYNLDPYLVRGFDYYTKTVFEIFSAKTPEKTADAKTGNTNGGHTDAQDTKDAEKSKDVPEQYEDKNPVAIGGGGRYDDLADMLYGRVVPGVGGTLGVDRVVNELKRQELKVRPDVSPKVFLIQLGTEAKKKSLLITEELRKGGIPFAHQLSKESLRGQLKVASRLGVSYALIIGQREALDERAMLREMQTGSQEMVPFQKIVTILKMRLKQK